MEAWGHHRYLGSTFSLRVLWVRREEQMSVPVSGVARELAL